METLPHAALKCYSACKILDGVKQIVRQRTQTANVLRGLVAAFGLPQSSIRGIGDGSGTTERPQSSLVPLHRQAYVVGKREPVGVFSVRQL